MAVLPKDSGLLRRTITDCKPFARVLRFFILHEPRFAPPALRRWLRRRLESNYLGDAELARAAFRHFNEGNIDVQRNDAPELVDRALDLGYLGWPRKIRAFIKGRDVLDVGCGTGAHGIGYVVVGATRYVGVDPRINPRKDRVKDLRSGRWVSFGWTGAQIMERMPRIKLIAGGVEQLPPEAQFDVAIMHNVTEHLPQLERVLEAAAQHIRHGGQLIFNHHNFYAWNGHHLSPKRVSAIDPDDAEQKNYVDWAHLDFDPDADHYINRGLNKVRIHELRAMTERWFDILEWELMPSDAERGAGRLTETIRARHPELSDLEFTTQSVFCRAAPKQLHDARDRRGDME